MKQVYDFYDKPTPDDAIKCIAGYFHMSDITNEKNAILLDFYYHTMMIAKDNQFSPEKASALFSIMKKTHTHCMSSPFIRMDADYAFFKDLLLKHCINRPPFSEQVFTFAEMKLITEFATNTYFRHYLMYKYTFTKQIKLDFKITNAYMTPLPSMENISITEPVEDAPDRSDVAPNAEAPLANIIEASAIIPTTVNIPTAVPVPPPAAPAEITQAPADLEPEGPKEEKTLEQTKQDIASAELRNFVISTLAPKLDEMKNALLLKMAVQEEQLGSKIKKLEAEEEKIMATLAVDKKKEVKKDVKGKK
ncbi:flagellar C1a complex subunit C1a-32-domain-containing protein [Obelidium mucronatum]|nr:flagellar C1a complex subunit C1a-32-domain-containing protein [Obelidium mucronatum]